MHIPFDSDDDDLNVKRDAIIKGIHSEPRFGQFKRVLVFVNSHTNEEGLINHAINGAIDFEIVRLIIVSGRLYICNTFHSFSIGCSRMS